MLFICLSSFRLSQVAILQYSSGPESSDTDVEALLLSPSGQSLFLVVVVVVVFLFWARFFTYASTLYVLTK